VYQYLPDSIRHFPPQEEFARMWREAGFSRVEYTNYSGGIVAIHVGVK
jgi:demethylmenaquinone methyltransferase/2-methoxy-6-polyprenyl-1,4-benzoquinol methylase